MMKGWVGCCVFVLWFAGSFAGVCDQIPLFEMSGPDCTAARQTVECGCSECMTWDPVLEDPAAGTPGAQWYEIGRVQPGGTDIHVVGSTELMNDYEEEPINRPTIWCFAWDEAIPLEGQLYLYRVRACVMDLVNGIAVSNCGDWSSRSIDYVAAPYVTTQFQPPIQGN